MTVTRTTTLAHLSDVHLAPVAGFWPRYWNTKRLLGWLNWQRKRRFIHTRAALDLVVADAKAQRPDHILVSGDLVNLGLPAEYAAALAWLATVGPPDRVSVVPGNHDIYVEQEAELCGRLWQDYMTGDAPDASRPAAPEFPYLRRIGDVAVIGVCSGVPTPPGSASGRVGEGQLERLRRLLDGAQRDGLVRVVMIHHPPLAGLATPRKALQDAVGMAAVLAAHGAELVVFGHNHLNMSERLGGIPVIGVGSASAARSRRGQPLACYNLIGITTGDRRPQIAIETRGFGDGSGLVRRLNHFEVLKG